MSDLTAHVMNHYGDVCLLDEIERLTKENEELKAKLGYNWKDGE